MGIFSIAKADFLQRVQAPKFGLILLFLAFLTFLMFPGANAKYSVMNIYGYRGIYDSIWIGDTLAVITGLILPLFAFYFIKSAISLDRITQTDTLIKSSGLPNYTYIIGKWFSNIALLGIFILLINFVAILKQFYLGESYEIDLIAQFRSQVYIAFPALMMTASFALFFETLPGLRSGFGNLIYMYVWMPIMIFSIEYGYGVGEIMEQLTVAVEKLGRITNGINIGGGSITEPLATFSWQGTDLTSAKITDGSLYMMAMSLGVLFLSWLFFAHQRKGYKINNPFKRKEKPLQDAAPYAIPTTLSPLHQTKNSLAMIPLLLGELRYILRARGWIWHGGLGFLLVLPFTLPSETILSVLVPIAGMWAVFAHSELGCRDEIHNTGSIMQPTVFGQSTRLLASWTSAVVIQLVTFSGLIVHFIISGQEISAVALLVGAMFIPALAIFLGRLSSTSRTFEFIYMLVWYMGPIDQNRGMDFLGTTINTAPTPISSFAIISVLLLIMGLSMDKLGTQIKRVRQFG